jgi:hypothetical protein
MDDIVDLPTVILDMMRTVFQKNCLDSYGEDLAPNLIDSVGLGKGKKKRGKMSQLEMV